MGLSSEARSPSGIRSGPEGWAPSGSGVRVFRTPEQIDRFVASTRDALFVREADNVLMIRPDKTMGINRSAAQILTSLYNREKRSAATVLPELVSRLCVDPDRLLNDVDALLQTVGAILNEDFTPRAGLSFGPFERNRVAYPTLSEIALTYDCQNACRFCYASSPHRAPESRIMDTGEVKRVMEKIFFQGHVPSLSFTGGEATLRPDLPELIQFGATLGFRVNLITNGVRAANPDFVSTLVNAGLASAQVSLEASEAALHDRIVGRSGAFARTVRGIRNLKASGIHVHTNTTLCALNLTRADDLIRFVARDLELKTLSMNMVIRTGDALAPCGGAKTQPVSEIGVTYTEVGGRLPGLLEVARAEGIRLVWYSPIPYCIFNPVLHGLGAKSCACVDGILSVDPGGRVLPCSSFGSGIGSLLNHSFDRIYRSRAAQYWRKKKFVPSACRGCPDVDICGGGCPLYWDAAGSFEELPLPGAGEERSYRKWVKSRVRSRSFGVQPPEPASGFKV